MSRCCGEGFVMSWVLSCEVFGVFMLSGSNSPMSSQQLPVFFCTYFRSCRSWLSPFVWYSLHWDCQPRPCLVEDRHTILLKGAKYFKLGNKLIKCKYMNESLYNHLESPLLKLEVSWCIYKYIYIYEKLVCVCDASWTIHLSTWSQ